MVVELKDTETENEREKEERHNQSLGYFKMLIIHLIGKNKKSCQICYPIFSFYCQKFQKKKIVSC